MRLFQATWVFTVSFGLAIVLSGGFPDSAGAQEPGAPRPSEPIIGGPCEGCEGVFEGLPATPGSVARIGPAGERGEPLVIDGTVRDRRGMPVAGIIVYAYQTDAAGQYRPLENAAGIASRRHGQLRAWARTDSLGRYRFVTVRPGHYPGRDAAAHVHMHVIEPGCCTYYIGDVLFRDDPVLSDRDRREAETAWGGSGLTSPARDPDGTWRVTRDIRLGAGVPGYDEARRRRP